MVDFLIAHVLLFFLFKQKTAYEMRISDWSSDVCSSDLFGQHLADIADDHVGKLQGDLARLPAADAAREVERDQRDMVAVDVEPDRKGTVGVDYDPHLRLAAPALKPPRWLDEPQILEPLGDIGDRRRGQSGHAREFAARRFFAEADRLQHDPLTIVARALEVRSRQAERQAGVARLGDRKSGV